MNQHSVKLHDGNNVQSLATRKPEAASLPRLEGRFGVIYADPPWQFTTFSAKGKGRSAEMHYDCMTFAELCGLPVRNHAAPDCCLILWTTDPMLPRALELIDAWGFEYKTVAFTWAKLNRNVRRPMFVEQDFFTGMGYWTRSNPEQCLLATIGRPQRISKAVRQFVIAPRREHSRKPDEVYGRIEALVSGPYLELFARNSRPGWSAWGNEVGLFHAGPRLAHEPPLAASSRCPVPARGQHILSLQNHHGRSPEPT